MSESSETRRSAAEEVSGGWAFRIATLFGIPVRIHFTFVLLVVWFAFVTGGGDLQRALGAAGFLLLLFGCVVLHELGHALMARRFGVRTREIVLYPIGGVARLENIPSGVAELLIALAGPAVNLVIAAATRIPGVLEGSGWLPQSVNLEWFARASVLDRLFIANLALFAFNLLPAFPMDGGRVLRALLSLWLPELQATEIAAAVGQGMAMLFGILGLLGGNFLLVFIAFFVFLGAAQEASFHRQRAAVRGHVASEAMVTDFAVLSPTDSLARAAELLLATNQQDFPVVGPDGRVLGVLTRAALLSGLAGQGLDSAVAAHMDTDVPIVSPDEPLQSVLSTLQSRPNTPVLVVGPDGLEGMVTLENLMEFIEVERALPTLPPAAGV